MFRSLLACIVLVTFGLNVAAQEGQNYQSADDLQRRVTFLLLNKNINEVTRQLDQENPSTVNSLLFRLVIYSRAGQTSRVRKTLEQLPSAPDWQCPGYDLKWLIRNADGGSLESRRLFYERLCPDDTEGAEQFVRLWSSSGDLKELDSWLAERSHDEWLMQRVQLRAKSGTAGELLDRLAAEVRSNPSDWTRLDRYLRANERASNLQDVKWLADAFDARTAGDSFQLAERIRNYSPQAAARLLQKSLEIPFAESDAKFVDDLINRYRSAGPSIKVNWEKQLRYWTKRSLAEAFQQMNQSLAAQPLVEELVSMKDADILLRDAHELAGAVQSGSGQRVVETKILRDEVARRSTAEYWLERARYYDGRQEWGLERTSFRQGLLAVVAKPDDDQRLNERYDIVRTFAYFLSREHNEKEDKAELEKLLTVELNSLPPETNYAFQIATLITQSELSLDELRNSLLAKRPSFLARLLDGRREWTNTEKALIENIVHREEVSAELKKRIWSSLETLAREPGSTRAYHLAAAMNDNGEWQRAIPLWRGYIQHANPSNWEGYKTDAISNLFTAYCRTKQWQVAEKFLLGQQESFWRVMPKALGEIAIVAAQQNAADDAVRLWRMSTNLDRRNLEPLSQLAATSLRPQLLAMYSEMKRQDPLSTIPDLALKMMQ